MSKKDSFRFAVKSKNNLISSVWRLQLTKNDVYLSVRCLMQTMKVSLHESGEWQISFTSEFVKKKEMKNQERHIEKWSNKNNITDGITLAFRICIPFSELREKYENTSKTVSYIEISEESGTIAEIFFIFTESNVEVSSWPGKNSMNTELLTKFQLDNGQKLWLVYTQRKMEEQDERNLENYKVKMLEYLRESGANTDGKHIRSVLIGSEEDGSRKFIDVALD